MLTKMSMRLLFTHTRMYLLICLQSLVIMVALIVFGSVFASRYDKLKFAETLLGDDGYVMNVDYIYEAGENPEHIICDSSESVEELLPGATAFCTYNVWCDIEDSYGEKQNLNMLAYDYEIANGYTPKLRDGRWFEKSDLQNLEIAAVVTENDCGITVGSEFFVTKDTLDNDLAEKITVHVVGVIADNEPFVGAKRNNSEKYNDIRSCFDQRSLSFEEPPVLLLLRDDFRQTEDALFGQAFVSIPAIGLQFISYRGMNEEEKRISDAIVSSDKVVCVEKIAYGDFMFNSKQYLWSSINEFLVFLFGLIVMVLITGISISAITTREQLEKYVIFYMNGLTWNRCILLQIMQQVLIQVFSLLLVLIGLLISKKMGLLEHTVISLGWLQLSCCLLYILLYNIASIVMPIFIMRRNTPKTILQTIEN